jgi:long-chain acyl-CoA synthetase
MKLNEIILLFHLKVKDIHLCWDMFTVENDLLTPTLKSKRPQLKTHFKAQLDAMYEKLE